MSQSVLVVDDAKVVRLMVISALKKIGESVYIDQAVDGVDGMKMANQKEYDLIITDLVMPNMDGIEFVNKIRKDSNNKFVKICVLSGETDEEKESEVRKAGANAFIKKPFEINKLLATFKKLLN